MEIHQIQKKIIRELAFADRLVFSDFGVLRDLEPDVFNYHLQALVKKGYINKNSDKSYLLTETGKSLLTMLDVANSMQTVKAPKVTVQAFILKNNITLLAKRLKHPFKNTIGFMSGKVNWGESFEDTLIRECAEEFGIIPTKYKLLAIRRCIDFDNKTKHLIFDSIYFTFLVTKFSGELINTEESECIWYDINKLDKEQLLPVTASILKEFSVNKKVKFFEVLNSHSLEL